MTTKEIMSSDKAAADNSKRRARIAGVLYLLVGMFGGFAEGFVDPRMYVSGKRGSHGWERCPQLGACPAWACSPTYWTGHSLSSWR